MKQPVQAQQRSTTPAEAVIVVVNLSGSQGARGQTRSPRELGFYFFCSLLKSKAQVGLHWAYHAQEKALCPPKKEDSSGQEAVWCPAMP